MAPATSSSAESWMTTLKSAVNSTLQGNCLRGPEGPESSARSRQPADKMQRQLFEFCECCQSWVFWTDRLGFSFVADDRRPGWEARMCWNCADDFMQEGAEQSDRQSPR